MANSPGTRKCDGCCSCAASKLAIARSKRANDCAPTTVVTAVTVSLSGSVRPSFGGHRTVLSFGRGRTSAVEVDNLRTRGDAAVVHVGGGARDLSQRGRLELAGVLRHAGHHDATRSIGLLPPEDPGVVELLGREVRTDGRASAVPANQD